MTEQAEDTSASRVDLEKDLPRRVQSRRARDLLKVGARHAIDVDRRRSDQGALRVEDRRVGIRGRRPQAKLRRVAILEADDHDAVPPVLGRPELLRVEEHRNHEHFGCKPLVEYVFSVDDGPHCGTASRATHRKPPDRVLSESGLERNVRQSERPRQRFGRHHRSHILAAHHRRHGDQAYPPDRIAAPDRSEVDDEISQWCQTRDLLLESHPQTLIVDGNLHDDTLICRRIRDTEKRHLAVTRVVEEKKLVSRGPRIFERTRPRWRSEDRRHPLTGTERSEGLAEETDHRSIPRTHGKNDLARSIERCAARERLKIGPRDTVHHERLVGHESTVGANHRNARLMGERHHIESIAIGIGEVQHHDAITVVLRRAELLRVEIPGHQEKVRRDLLVGDPRAVDRVSGARETTV